MKRRQYQVGKAIPDEPEIAQPWAARGSHGIVPKIPFRLICSGASGSGKSNAARYILDHFYVKDNNSNQSFFDKIIIFSPTCDLDPMWKDLTGLRKRDRHQRPQASMLKNLLDKAERDTKRVGKAKAPKILIILDDVIAESKFMTSPAFLRLFIRGRHGMISTIIMTQSYVKIPRSSRIQATHLIMFPSQATEIERLYNEYGPHQLNKNAFFAMVKEATERTENEKWPFLYLDRYAPIEQRFRRNLDLALNVSGFAKRYGSGDSLDALSKKKKNKRKSKSTRREEEEEEEEAKQNAMYTEVD